MISIIIPVYNSEKTISRCLDSILSQSYLDWEAICIDDGSTDNSGIICDEYSSKDSRIKVFHQNNQGVSAARNVGLRTSIGEYVTFADSDDWLESCAFQEYFDAFAKYDADIIRTGYIRDNNNGIKEVCIADESSLYTNTWELYRATIKYKYYSFLWNSCVRRTCLTGTYFNEEINYLEDHTFLYQCYLNSRSVALINKITYHYSICNDESLSHIKDPEVLRKAAEIEREYHRILFFGKDPELEKESNSMYSYHIHTIVNLLYTYPFSLSYKYNIMKECKLLSDFVYKEEKLFFFSFFPFFFRDLLLRLWYFFKK